MVCVLWSLLLGCLSLTCTSLPPTPGVISVFLRMPGKAGGVRQRWKSTAIRTGSDVFSDEG